MTDTPKSLSEVKEVRSLGTQANPFVSKDNPKPPLEPEIVKNPLLAGVATKVIKQAWFTVAHLVLAKDSVVLDIRCKNGVGTYAMAAMNPEIQFIGIDPKASDIKIAIDKYKLPNLKFMSGDFQENFIPKGSIDAIINSFTLYKTYAESKANEQAVIDSLERQLELLKNDGLVFIQSHTMKSFSDFTLMELVNEQKRRGDPNDIQNVSDIDLLLAYSEQAGIPESNQHSGFYLEELPARFPKTRLFRMPTKWAYEFVLKKNERKNWEKNLHKEHSFFTRDDFRRVFKNFGTRILYSAPHWDDQLTKMRFDKSIRLFNEDGSPMETPESSFILVAQKIKDMQSTILQERKPTYDSAPSIRLTTMRNNVEGNLVEVASRDMHFAEILPYRISVDGRLHVFVHTDTSRPLMNSIPRNGNSLDGKQWSGHMIEAFSLPDEHIKALDKKNIRHTLNFTQEHMGLKTKVGALFHDGPGFYPAPDCVDEHVNTHYIEVKKPKGPIAPKSIAADIDGFSSHGTIEEIDGQKILNAIGVGFIPSSRLEVQILALYEKLGIDYQAWAECPLILETHEPEKVTSLQEIIAKLAASDNRLEITKANAGQLKSIKSIFVDEGRNKGGIRGLASRDMDFITNEENTINTAIVLPLCKKVNGEVMAGIIEQYLPAPQRYKGNGYMLSCPSIPLPSDITNFEQAKMHIAEKFEVPIENVARMGEGYFSHIGLTPQRIYPFAISQTGTSGWRKVGRTHGVTTHAPLYDLYRLLYLDSHDSFLKIVAMSYQASIGLDSDLSANVSFSEKHAERKNSFVGMSDTYATPQPVYNNSIDSSEGSTGSSSASRKYT